jgi:drug/metabolite transporter (DMT)-like permease
VQLLTMGVVFTLLAVVDGLHLPQGSDWLVFGYLTVVAAAVALLVQTWAQAHLGSGQAAVLMVLEPVWAAFFGFVIFDELLDGRALVGGALVLGASLLVIGRRATAPSVEPRPVHP